MKVGLTNSHASSISLDTSTSATARDWRRARIEWVNGIGHAPVLTESSGWKAAQTPFRAASTFAVPASTAHRHAAPSRRESAALFRCAGTHPALGAIAAAHVLHLSRRGTELVAVDERLGLSSTLLRAGGKELRHPRDIFLVGHVGNEFRREFRVSCLGRTPQARPARSRVTHRLGPVGSGAMPHLNPASAIFEAREMAR